MWWKGRGFNGVRIRVKPYKGQTRKQFTFTMLVEQTAECQIEKQLVLLTSIAFWMWLLTVITIYHSNNKKKKHHRLKYKNKTKTTYFTDNFTLYLQHLKQKLISVGKIKSSGLWWIQGTLGIKWEYTWIRRQSITWHGMFFGGRRKPKNPEETHADTGRTSRIKPGPWSCKVAMLPAASSSQTQTHSITRRFGHMIKHLHATGHFDCFVYLLLLINVWCDESNLFDTSERTEATWVLLVSYKGSHTNLATDTKNKVEI